MKICSVVGTRPNFVKEYLVNRELRRRGIREVLIHTGQHYDYEMSQAFFDCFELPAPDHHLRISNTENVSFSAQALVSLAEIFRTEQPDCVLVCVDTRRDLREGIQAARHEGSVTALGAGVEVGERLLLGDRPVAAGGSQATQGQAGRRSDQAVAELLAGYLGSLGAGLGGVVTQQTLRFA